MNSVYGYEIGDSILKNVSERLITFLGKQTFISRFGDASFVCMATDELKISKNQLLKRISKPIKVDKEEIFFRVLIGKVYFPQDGLEVKDIIKSLDLSIQLNKCRKRFPSQKEIGEQELIQRVKLENEITMALKKNQFELFLQPKVLWKEKKIKGAEALLRWTHPRYGAVSPVDFIPIAEETGLIIEMGEWVFEEVCKVLQKWKNNKHSR
nr:GGDEF domain-containing phosphodiesterase [Bacillus coahuilensis]